MNYGNMGYGSMGGQPIFILPEGAIRKTGRDALKNNIEAATAVAESVRTTLGPNGMDKMLVSSIGDVTITNDGATILDEMELEHPAAKMMVDVAKTQEQEVGDGTTTAVVLSGELLKKSSALVDQNIHPSIITAGYRLAKAKALEILNDISYDVDISEDDILEKIAMTAMTGKGSEAAKDSLATLVVKAVKTVAQKNNGKLTIDKEDIKIEKRKGASIDDTELISGIVIDKEVVHSGMPKKLSNAKILLIDSALEVKEIEGDAKIQINTPDQMQAFIDQQSKQLKDMVEKIDKTGANVVFCQKGIDDLAQHYLAKKGIMAVRRVKSSDMEKLSKATGATIVTNMDDMTSKDLGTAGIVEEVKVSGEAMVFVRECPNPKSVTILVRGGTDHVVDEVERALEDAILGIISALELGKIVTGGGAIEIELSKKLKEYADTIGGREQLAINAFADALEIIPKTLAESTGLDPIDALVELRSRHEKGEKDLGVDVRDRKLANMYKLNVIEPLKIKTQAIKSSAEAAEMILRIDDVIAASKMSSSPKGGAPGGMPGGMPPGY